MVIVSCCCFSCFTYHKNLRIYLILRDRVFGIIIYNAKKLPLKPDHNNTYTSVVIERLHRRRRNMYVLLSFSVVHVGYVYICKQSVYGLFISLSHKLYSKIINDGDYVLCVYARIS